MIIVGAKGFAKQLVEIFFQKDQTEGLFFFDNVSTDIPDKLYDIPILRSMDMVKEIFTNQSPDFCLGMGTPAHRKQLADMFREAGGRLTSVISSHAQIASHVKSIGSGVTILDGVIIENDVTIGDGVLINSQCTIHHDSFIGNFSEISPGARILGNCHLGNECLIGANAVILPKLTLHDQTIVGAGAVVTKNVSERTTVVGIPAKPFKPLR